MPGTSEISNTSSQQRITEGHKNSYVQTIGRGAQKARETASNIWSDTTDKFSQGREKFAAQTAKAQHQAHLAAHRTATSSPYSIIGVGKGALLSAGLGALGVGAYFATTAAVTVTLVITPAAVLWGAAALVAAATVYSLVANFFTKSQVPAGTDPLSVDSDVQEQINALAAAKNEVEEKLAQLQALEAKKSKAEAEELAQAQHASLQQTVANEARGADIVATN